MKNGKFYKVGVKRIHLVLCGVLCLLCGLVSLGSCRSTRNAVEETHREIHATVKESVEADSLNTATATREENTDSTEIRAEQHAIVEIKRDSVGRIVGINVARSGKVRANTKRKTDSDLSFHSFKASRSSEASDSVAAITQKKKETTTEVDSRIPLECIIGWSLIGLVILFYAGDYIYRLWKKKTEL